MRQLTSAYLVGYNGVQLGIWGATLVKCLLHLASGGSVRDLYSVCRTLVRAGLAGALLEILHAYAKVVRSPVATTAVQCLVRAFVVVGAVEVDHAARVDQTVWCGQMVLAWAVSESIRYSYYLAALLSPKPPVNKADAPAAVGQSRALRLLTWLRYSAFIVLYPIGIAGEMGCFRSAIPALEVSKKWSVELPNRWNFAFSYPRAIWVSLLVLYPLGGWTLYSYMLQQRKRQFQPRPPAPGTPSGTDPAGR